MDEKKPKPCPRCGKPAHVVDLISGYGTMYSVACNDQSCMFFEPTRAYSTVDEAVDEWNTRFVEPDTNDVEDVDVIGRCPFCREDAASVQKVDEWDENVEVYQVFCENCGASGPAKFSKEKAVEAWNEGSSDCDREALLKIANKMEWTAKNDTYDDGLMVSAWLLDMYANDIREACGVVDE